MLRTSAVAPVSTKTPTASTVGVASSAVAALNACATSAKVCSPCARSVTSPMVTSQLEYQVPSAEGVPGAAGRNVVKPTFSSLAELKKTGYWKYVSPSASTAEPSTSAANTDAESTGMVPP